MPGRQPRTRSLNIFLIKQDVGSPDNALLDPTSLARSRVAISNEIQGDLYLKPSPDRIPSWWSLFEGPLGAAPPDIRNSSVAAVLLFTVGARAIALTFGYGRSLLRPGTWEEDFGLRVTLNAVDPLKIRSVDRVKFDAISQHSQIQAS